MFGFPFQGPGAALSSGGADPAHHDGASKPSWGVSSNIGLKAMGVGIYARPHQGNCGPLNFSASCGL